MQTGGRKCAGKKPSRRQRGRRQIQTEKREKIPRGIRNRTDAKMRKLRMNPSACPEAGRWRTEISPSAGFSIC